MQLSHVFLQIKIPAKSFLTNRTRKWLFVVVRVHVKCQVVQLEKEKGFVNRLVAKIGRVHLVERLVAHIALVRLLSTVGQSVVLVVALLVESLSTELALERLVPVVYPHVCVQGGTPVEGFSTHLTFVRFLIGVDYLVSTQG